jgi:hypothetical protein
MTVIKGAALLLQGTMTDLLKPFSSWTCKCSPHSLGNHRQKYKVRKTTSSKPIDINRQANSHMHVNKLLAT